MILKTAAFLHLNLGIGGAWANWYGFCLHKNGTNFFAINFNINLFN